VVQYVAVYCRMLQCIAAFGLFSSRFIPVLQCVALCCSVLQRVAVYYGVLQLAAHSHLGASV